MSVRQQTPPTMAAFEQQDRRRRNVAADVGKMEKVARALTNRTNNVTLTHVNTKLKTSRSLTRTYVAAAVCRMGRLVTKDLHCKMSEMCPSTHAHVCTQHSYKKQ